MVKRGYEAIGSDIQKTYDSVTDGSSVTIAPYVSLDITNEEAVHQVITELRPDAVIPCAAWTAVDMAEDDDAKGDLVRQQALQRHVRLIRDWASQYSKKLDLNCYLYGGTR